MLARSIGADDVEAQQLADVALELVPDVGSAVRKLIELGLVLDAMSAALRRHQRRHAGARCTTFGWLTLDASGWLSRANFANFRVVPCFYHLRIAQQLTEWFYILRTPP